MNNEVVNLSHALASFEETWDPRIVGSVNDDDVRVAHIEASR